MIVTLDTFWDASPAIRAVASMAAEIGTDRTNDPDSVWAGESYGGRVSAIQRLPGATLALTAELQRIVDRHAIDGTIAVTQEGARINADIIVTSEGLELG